MKVKINNKGKRQSYTIQNWNDITLDKWLRLIKRKDKSVTKEVIDTLKEMSDIPENVFKKLSLKDVSVLFESIRNEQMKSGSRFLNKIKLEGVEYGFIPNLEELTLGEYADIETYLKNGVEDNMHNITAVLYRPIIEQEGETYSIEAYGDSDSRVRAEKFKKMKANQVQASLVFFWTLGSELLKTLQLCLEKRTMQSILNTTKAEWTQVSNLQKSGVGSV
jgi:hypothetical protein